MKTDSKLRITPYGDCFITYLTEIKFEIWTGLIFEKYAPLKKYAMETRSSEITKNMMGRSILYEI